MYSEDTMLSENMDCGRVLEYMTREKERSQKLTHKRYTKYNTQHISIDTPGAFI